MKNEEEIKRELEELGIDIFHPQSPKEIELAEAFEAFSSFVLFENASKCQSILSNHLGGDSVGALQGGNEEYPIYRVVIPPPSDNDDDDDDDEKYENEACTELFREFYLSYSKYTHIFSTKSLEEYMLSICAQRGVQKLRNVMFIMAFGPVVGQVRHIDNMVTNVQICLYMSKDCPSTIIYSLDEPRISNVNELLHYWELMNDLKVPNLIRTILEKYRNTKLNKKWYSKFFVHWESIDSQLECFGKLYQTVSSSLSLTVDPGTTLVAGGNDVHAGPPTCGPRLFAFATGILDEDNVEEDNDGEVQYSPVLFHVDLCCILFAIMDFDFHERKSEHFDSKKFLLQILVSFVKEYPIEPFDILLTDERGNVRDWLLELVRVLQSETKISIILEEGVQSETIFYSPDVIKRRTKKKKRISNTVQKKR